MRTWVGPILTFMVFTTPINGGVLKVADVFKFWSESGISKEMVRAQISNAKCFSSNESLAACRIAMDEVKRESADSEFQWVEDDFNAVVDQIDLFPPGRKSKEWYFGLMLNSYARAFDAHASILPDAAFDAIIGPDEDAHYGAGINIMATDAGVFIRTVTPNSPAEAAGLKPFDRLLTVNGVEVGTGVRGHKNSDLIKGRSGDVVQITVDRAGVTKNIPLTIGVVSERNVEPDVIAFNGRRYGYVRLLQFKRESCDDLRGRIRALPKSIIGLILDLRDNPGGVLEEGICVAGLFAGRRDIVGQKLIDVKFPFETGYRPRPDGVISWQPSYRSAAFPDMPLIVLINQNSASAAEIVAGALQDYKLAWIVGDNSFGKGSVQTIEPMPGDSRFYQGYTTALFYRPSGTTNQLVGVTPNFKLPMRRRATPAERRGPREGDLYPNSIKPDEPAAMLWQETRPEADYIRRCVESTAVDLTANELIVKKTGSEDYQKAYALGVLDCSVGSTAQHNSSALKKVIGQR